MKQDSNRNDMHFCHILTYLKRRANEIYCTATEFGISKEPPMSNLISALPQRVTASERASDILSIAMAMVSGFVLLLAVAAAY